MESKMKKEKFNPVFDGLAEFEMNQLFSELDSLQDTKIQRSDEKLNNFGKSMMDGFGEDMSENLRNASISPQPNTKPETEKS